jgi:hypothetical protein
MRFPQIIVCTILFADLLVGFLQHGEPRRDKYSFPKAVFDVLIWLWLLRQGGFF